MTISTADRTLFKNIFKRKNKIYLIINFKFTSESNGFHLKYSHFISHELVKVLLAFSISFLSQLFNSTSIPWLDTLWLSFKLCFMHLRWGNSLPWPQLPLLGIHWPWEVKILIYKLFKAYKYK